LLRERSGDTEFRALSQEGGRGRVGTFLGRGIRGGRGRTQGGALSLRGGGGGGNVRERKESLYGFHHDIVRLRGAEEGREASVKGGDDGGWRSLNKKEIVLPSSRGEKNHAQRQGRRAGKTSWLSMTIVHIVRAGRGNRSRQKGTAPAISSENGEERNARLTKNRAC